MTVRSGPRVGVAATLAAVMISASLMQFALGALGPFLTDEFGLSRSGLGLVTGSYYLAAAGLSPMMGRWVTVIGAPRGMVLSAALGALGTALVAAAGSVVWLVGAVLVAGAAAAAANPATNLAISALERPHAVLMGVKQSGVQAAAFLTGASLPVIALGLDWRAALLCCTAASTVTLVALLAGAARRRPVGHRQAAATPGASAGVRRLAVYAALMGAGAASVNTYLVLFAHERIGMDVRLAGGALAVVGLVAIVTRISWPVLAERAPRPAATGVVMLRWVAVAAAAATLVIGCAEWLGPAGLWIGAVLTGMSTASWNGLAMLVVVHTTDLTRVARSSARVQGAFFGGLMVSPLVFGALVDRLGYGYGWLWTGGCFLAALAALGRGRDVQPRGTGAVRRRSSP